MIARPDAVDARAVDRFSREGTLLLGGAYAILLQVADPVVAAAVEQYSDFASRPLHRLHNTLTFVYGVMLGSPAEAAIVAKATTATHARIPAANDPAHQLWVAATLYETAMRVHERIHGSIGEPERAAVLAAYSRLATCLNVSPASWPASPAEFAAYWSAAVNELEVGSAARQVAYDLFHPTTAPLWLRAILPLTSLLTASLLDPTLRDAYGMPWSRARERRAAAAWSCIRALTLMLPQRVLTAPSRRYLARVTAMLNRAS
jgi:uncharacterized protein (DUF2236 family)